MNSLYIFADSERPDQYINPIVHCVLKKDVRYVNIIHIKNFGKSQESNLRIDGFSSRILEAIQVQINGLAERGEYTFYDEKRKGERLFLASEYGDERARIIQRIYCRCRSIPLS